jgi:RNA recognition motif-containing protein
MQLSVKKLYLGGVKEPITENDLRDYFGQFGSITDVVVMKDREGQYRGYVKKHFLFIFMISISFF